MALNFTTTDVAAQSSGVKCLVYGASGVGKTVLCGTAPSPLILSAERGLLSLRGISVPALEINNAADLDDALNWCRDHAVSHGIQTICLDSISEIVEQVLSDEKSKTRDARAAYGEMANRAINYVKQFRDLPGLHVVVVAKEETATDPVTGVSRALPTAPGRQVGSALPYLFDEVFRAATGKHPETGATFHYLQTHTAETAVAKDRSGVLEAVEYYPDLTAIITKILSTPPTT